MVNASFTLYTSFSKSILKRLEIEKKPNILLIGRNAILCYLLEI